MSNITANIFVLDAFYQTSKCLRHLTLRSGGIENFANTQYSTRINIDKKLCLLKEMSSYMEDSLTKGPK